MSQDAYTAIDAYANLTPMRFKIVELLDEWVGATGPHKPKTYSDEEPSSVGSVTQFLLRERDDLPFRADPDENPDVVLLYDYLRVAELGISNMGTERYPVYPDEDEQTLLDQRNEIGDDYTGIAGAVITLIEGIDGSDTLENVDAATGQLAALRGWADEEGYPDDADNDPIAEILEWVTSQSTA